MDSSRWRTTRFQISDSNQTYTGFLNEKGNLIGEEFRDASGNLQMINNFAGATAWDPNTGKPTEGTAIRTYFTGKDAGFVLDYDIGSGDVRALGYQTAPDRVEELNTHGLQLNINNVSIDEVGNIHLVDDSRVGLENGKPVGSIRELIFNGKGKEAGFIISDARTGDWQEGTSINQQVLRSNELRDVNAQQAIGRDRLGFDAQASAGSFRSTALVFIDEATGQSRVRVVSTERGADGRLTGNAIYVDFNMVQRDAGPEMPVMGPVMPGMEKSEVTVSHTTAVKGTVVDGKIVGKDIVYLAARVGSGLQDITKSAKEAMYQVLMDGGSRGITPHIESVGVSMDGVIEVVALDGNRRVKVGLPLSGFFNDAGKQDWSALKTDSEGRFIAYWNGAEKVWGGGNNPDLGKLDFVDPEMRRVLVEETSRKDMAWAISPDGRLVGRSLNVDFSKEAGRVVEVIWGMDNKKFTGAITATDGISSDPAKSRPQIDYMGADGRMKDGQSVSVLNQKMVERGITDVSLTSGGGLLLTARDRRTGAVVASYMADVYAEKENIDANLNRNFNANGILPVAPFQAAKGVVIAELNARGDGFKNVAVFDQNGSNISTPGLTQAISSGVEALRDRFGLSQLTSFGINGDGLTIGGFNSKGENIQGSFKLSYGEMVLPGGGRWVPAQDRLTASFSGATRQHVAPDGSTVIESYAVNGKSLDHVSTTSRKVMGVGLTEAVTVDAHGRQLARVVTNALGQKMTASAKSVTGWEVKKDSGFWSKVGGWFADAGKGILGALDAVWDGVYGAVFALKHDLTGSIRSALGSIGGGLVAIGKWVGSTAQSAWDGYRAMGAWIRANPWDAAAGVVVAAVGAVLAVVGSPIWIAIGIGLAISAPFVAMDVDKGAWGMVAFDIGSAFIPGAGKLGALAKEKVLIYGAKMFGREYAGTLATQLATGVAEGAVKGATAELWETAAKRQAQNFIAQVGKKDTAALIRAVGADDAGRLIGAMGGRRAAGLVATKGVGIEGFGHLAKAAAQGADGITTSSIREMASVVGADRFAHLVGKAGGAENFITALKGQGGVEGFTNLFRDGGFRAVSRAFAAESASGRFKPFSTFASHGLNRATQGLKLGAAVGTLSGVSTATMEFSGALMQGWSEDGLSGLLHSFDDAFKAVFGKEGLKKIGANSLLGGALGSVLGFAAPRLAQVWLGNMRNVLRSYVDKGPKQFLIGEGGIVRTGLHLAAFNASSFGMAFNRVMAATSGHPYSYGDSILQGFSFGFFSGALFGLAIPGEAFGKRVLARWAEGGPLKISERLGLGGSLGQQVHMTEMVSQYHVAAVLGKAAGSVLDRVLGTDNFYGFDAEGKKQGLFSSFGENFSFFLVPTRSRPSAGAVKANEILREGGRQAETFLGDVFKATLRGEKSVSLEVNGKRYDVEITSNLRTAADAVGIRTLNDSTLGQIAGAKANQPIQLEGKTYTPTEAAVERATGELAARLESRGVTLEQIVFATDKVQKLAIPDALRAEAELKYVREASYSDLARLAEGKAPEGRSNFVPGERLKDLATRAMIEREIESQRPLVDVMRDAALPESVRQVAQDRFVGSLSREHLLGLRRGDSIEIDGRTYTPDSRMQSVAKIEIHTRDLVGRIEGILAGDHINSRQVRRAAINAAQVISDSFKLEGKILSPGQKEAIREVFDIGVRAVNEGRDLRPGELRVVQMLGTGMGKTIIATLFEPLIYTLNTRMGKATVVLADASANVRSLESDHRRRFGTRIAETLVVTEKTSDAEITQAISQKSPKILFMDAQELGTRFARDKSYEAEGKSTILKDKMGILLADEFDSMVFLPKTIIQSEFGKLNHRQAETTKDGIKVGGRYDGAQKALWETVTSHAQSVLALKGKDAVSGEFSSRQKTSIELRADLVERQMSPEAVDSLGMVGMNREARVARVKGFLEQAVRALDSRVGEAYAVSQGKILIESAGIGRDLVPPDGFKQVLEVKYGLEITRARDGKSPVEGTALEAVKNAHGVVGLTGTVSKAIGAVLGSEFTIKGLGTAKADLILKNDGSVARTDFDGVRKDGQTRPYADRKQMFHNMAEAMKSPDVQAIVSFANAADARMFRNYLRSRGDFNANEMRFAGLTTSGPQITSMIKTGNTRILIGNVEQVGRGLDVVSFAEKQLTYKLAEGLAAETNKTVTKKDRNAYDRLTRGHFDGVEFKEAKYTAKEVSVLEVGKESGGVKITEGIRLLAEADVMASGISKDYKNLRAYSNIIERGLGNGQSVETILKQIKDTKAGDYMPVKMGDKESSVVVTEGIRALAERGVEPVSDRDILSRSIGEDLGGGIKVTEAIKSLARSEVKLYIADPTFMSETAFIQNAGRGLGNRFYGQTTSIHMVTDVQTLMNRSDADARAKFKASKGGITVDLIKEMLPELQRSAEFGQIARSGNEAKISDSTVRIGERAPVESVAQFNRKLSQSSIAKAERDQVISAFSADTELAFPYEGKQHVSSKGQRIAQSVLALVSLPNEDREAVSRFVSGEALSVSSEKNLPCIYQTAIFFEENGINEDLGVLV
ncbi:MAG: hypothetical protein ACT4O3_03695, partial [Elusimicrobiota bacterium]